ncbi:cupin domain-containing protein [Streptomyces sp. BH106]|uniref:cupin domain-containing protein n=1 Tax=Streptomyces sp. BH106 TaxID=3410409 RepID=UPI003CEDF9ED
MPEVKKIPFDATQITRYARTHTDDRYKSSSLKVMGPSFMTWDEDGSAGRFTINYEEVIYVVEGEITLTFHPEDAEPEVITAVPGDVVTITAGSNLDYTGTKGSKMFVVFSPLNWEELLDSGNG